LFSAGVTFRYLHPTFTEQVPLVETTTRKNSWLTFLIRLPGGWKCASGKSLASNPNGFSSSMLIKFKANIPHGSQIAEIANGIGYDSAKILRWVQQENMCDEKKM